MANGLDIVPIRIKDIGGVVVGMVVCSQTRGAIVDAACFQGFRVERIHLSMVFCRKRDPKTGAPFSDRA